MKKDNNKFVKPAYKVDVVSNGSSVVIKESNDLADACFFALYAADSFSDGSFVCVKDDADTVYLTVPSSSIKLPKQQR